MPCYTVVKMEVVPNDRFTIAAKKKLGIALDQEVTADVAQQIKLEAGKLKTIELVKRMNPGAQIRGTATGSQELQIDLEI